MVARGDLSIKLPVYEVFVQKQLLLLKCWNGWLINLRPTRAEFPYVGNVVLDGAYYAMLLGGTAKGKYPLDCFYYGSD